MNPDIFGGFPGARFIGEEELRSVAKVIEARSPYRFYGLQPQRMAESLETEFAQFCGRKYAVAVSSGTAALHTALAALGVGKGDEVIVPAYGWSADIMAVLAVGAVPVIVGVDAALGLDSMLLKEAIGPATKAVIAVHMRGRPCKIRQICKIAQDHGVAVIEDCAQCLGGEVDDRPIGGFGEIGVFSFQYNKLITGGEGGALVCDCPSLFEKAFRFHDLGMFRKAGLPDPTGETAIVGVGLNYRMTELQAAMILPQLKKIPAVLEGLRQSVTMARSLLDGYCKAFGLIDLPIRSDSKPNNAFLCFAAPTKEAAQKAVDAMAGDGVPAQICGHIDPHHFTMWENFLMRGGHPFKNLTGTVETGSRDLDRTIFVELVPQVEADRP